MPPTTSRAEHQLFVLTRRGAAGHAARIRYLHLKDVDDAGTRAMLGRGACDARGAIETVRRAPRFNGWVVLEEESDEASADPAAAVRRNRETIGRLLA